MVSHYQGTFKSKNLAYGKKSVYVTSLESQKEISLNNSIRNINGGDREINWFISFGALNLKIKI